MSQVYGCAVPALKRSVTKSKCKRSNWPRWVPGKLREASGRIERDARALSIRCRRGHLGETASPSSCSRCAYFAEAHSSPVTFSGHDHPAEVASAVAIAARAAGPPTSRRYQLHRRVLAVPSLRGGCRGFHIQDRASLRPRHPHLASVARYARSQNSEMSSW